MNTPFASSITPNSITLQWLELTSTIHTGGDPVSFYQLEWEQTSGVWIPLTDPSIDGKVLQKTHTLSGG